MLNTSSPKTSVVHLWAIITRIKYESRLLSLLNHLTNPLKDSGVHVLVSELLGQFAKYLVLITYIRVNGSLVICFPNKNRQEDPLEGQGRPRGNQCLIENLDERVHDKDHFIRMELFAHIPSTC